jgi:hypothetical protein
MHKNNVNLLCQVQFKHDAEIKKLQDKNNRLQSAIDNIHKVIGDGELRIKRDMRMYCCFELTNQEKLETYPQYFIDYVRNKKAFNKIFLGYSTEIELYEILMRSLGLQENLK